jgi:hypothetical protein
MGSEMSGTLELEYGGSDGTPTRDKVAEMALEDWRAFTDDPEASLPWNTSIKVKSHEMSYEAFVVIRWERVSN